ncbi:MAG: hypothetical protein WA532_02295 [Candidatus Korobacteraceae bacterium]
MNKPIFAAVLLAGVSLVVPVLAQNKPAETLGAPGCGEPGATFKVKTDNLQHPARPEAGKALVFFIQDDTEFAVLGRPSTRFGLDGKWAGATHANSYFYVSVDSGVHHLCASWQSGERTAADHFTAKAGDVYYFEAKDILGRPENDLIFNRIDSDEGKLLISQYKFSTSQKK